MKPGDQQGNELQTIIFRALGVGVQIAAMAVIPVLVNLFLGLWIDRKLGTSPWATLALLGLGTIVAVIGSYRVMVPFVATHQQVEWSESMRSLVFVARIGLVTITPLLVGLFLGLWIDVQLNTRPWVTLALTVLGAASGLVGAWRLSSGYLRRMTRSDQEEDL
jgi:F0F1-type ATP synthase assembly protein I